MGGRSSGAGFLASLTRPHSAGLESGARLAAVVAGTLLIGTGLLHISAAGDHTNLPVMLAGFLVVAALQAALGGLLLFRRPGRLLVAGGVALTLGALATWLVSRTAGLPFLPGGHMEPIGFKDGVTVLFEVLTVPVLALLASAELDEVRFPSPRLGSHAVGLLGAGMFALFVPAFTLGGGEHHSAGEMAAHAHGEDAHGQDSEELAAASGGHLGHEHGDGGRHARAGDHHGDKNGGAGSHPHGQPATAEFFSDAHEGHELASADQDHANHDGGGGGHADGDHDEGSADTPDGDHQHEGGDRDGTTDHHGGGDNEHGADDHGSGGHGDAPSESPQGGVAVEWGEQDESGKPTRGSAVVVYDRGDENVNGEGHHGEPCDPTADQQSAADRIVAEVKAELRQYENNPGAALADGFNYVFGPTDRMLHVVHTRRVDDPTVMKAAQIESFIYYMTDTGFVPIGGMFIMPRNSTSGPEPGGCLTRWHAHGGVVGRWATAGTSDTTPLMMHVFTYPGLDPWGHYTGRDLAPLWTPGGWVPSLCRSSADANTGCLP